MGTSATIRVYEGDNTMGTPLVIDESNALDYVNNVKSLQFDGPVTITYESGGITGSTGDHSNLRVELRYLTGDQIMTTPFGRLTAVWTDFLAPIRSSMTCRSLSWINLAVYNMEIPYPLS